MSGPDLDSAGVINGVLPVPVSSSKIVYDKNLRLYLQEVALTNTGATAVNGPVFLILEDLSSRVTLGEQIAAHVMLRTDWQRVCRRASRRICAGARYYGGCSAGIQ